GGQQVAQADDRLDLRVLVDGIVEEAGLRADRDLDLAVLVALHGADGLQQRHHIVPLDVVAHGVLEDLPKGVTVVAGEVLSSWVRRHRSSSSGQWPAYACGTCAAYVSSGRCPSRSGDGTAST